MIGLYVACQAEGDCFECGRVYAVAKEMKPLEFALLLDLTRFIPLPATACVVGCGIQMHYEIL
jgi:hypothetical protein